MADNVTNTSGGSSKALKIIGIGCGVLVLIGLIMVGAGAWWAKSKVQGMADWSEKVDEQNKELKALDKKYAFKAPPKGQPLTLTEDRLKKYLAIRHELQPVIQKFEKEGKKFEGKNEKNTSFTDATAALGMMGDMMTELRAKFVEQLNKHEMSPREFHSTTAAIYTAGVGQATSEMAKVQKEALTQQIQMYEEQLKQEGLSAEEKASLEEGLEDAKSQLAEVSAEAQNEGANTQVHAANAALIKNYKDEIEKEANLFLDGVLTSGDDEWSNAFDNASGDEGQ